MKKCAKTTETYLKFIAKAGRPVTFSEVVQQTPGYNGFYRLRLRGLIENVIPGYTGKEGEEFTGPRVPAYVLTVKGWQTLLQAEGSL